MQSCLTTLSFLMSIKLASLSLSSSGPIQLGLTGSIGMGKSTITKQFRKLGFNVFDADAMVHKLYSNGGEAVPLIGKVFPDVITDNSVDRTKLAKKVLDSSSGADNFKLLESLIHPLVAKKREEFYTTAGENHELLVVYDIPLLFEKRSDYKVDYVIVATANSEEQRRRVLKRPGMTYEKFESILSKQVPDDIKRSQADYLVRTDYSGYSEAKAQIANIVENIIQKNHLSYVRWTQQSKRKPPIEVTTTNTAINTDINTATATATATATSTSSFQLKDHFDLILFDIDDTLVPLMGPINSAINKLHEYAAINMPKSFNTIKLMLRDKMNKLIDENPLVAHNLTEVRYLSLKSIAREFEEDGHVDEAMRIFMEARSDLEPYFYSDVKSFLDWVQITHEIPIGIITNGNVNITYCSYLNEKMSFCLGAADVGAKKPSVIPFVAAANTANIPCDRILYIGDSYECDVVGAISSGMHATLLQRKKEIDSDSDNLSEFSVENIHINDFHSTQKYMKISQLSPEYFTNAIKNYFIR